MNNETYAVIFGLLSMVGYGLANGFSKKGVALLGPIRATVYREFITIPFLIVAMLFTLHQAHFIVKDIAFGITIGILSYGGLYFFLKGAGVGKISIVSSIVSSRLLITSLTAVLFLGDSLKNLGIIGMLFIVIGVVLVSIDLRTLDFQAVKNDSGVKFALLAALIWGVTFAYFSIPAAAIGGIFFSVLLESTVLFTSRVQLFISKESFFVEDKIFRQSLVPIFLMGATGALGTLALNLGFTYGSISIVNTISSSSPLITVLFGVFILKEKLSLQQIIAIAFILFGIVLVAS